MGEYAVLETGRALVLAHKPAFQVTYVPGSDNGKLSPDSPAGKIATQVKLNIADFVMKDPHRGAGGFGASGAEFLAVLAAANQPLGWPALGAYRAMGSPGSGADILAQSTPLAALPSIVDFDLSEPRLEIWPAGELGLHSRLFHTGKKINTHEHLARNQRPDTEKLDAIVKRAQVALARSEAAKFALEVQAYGATLAEEGFLAPHSALALADVRDHFGLLAAKGCGALGSDVLLLLGVPGFTAPEGWAEKHSLVEVASFPI